MIAWLFFVFLALGIILIIAGFVLDVPVILFVGSTLVFLLGMNLLDVGLDYKSGELEAYQYGNNFSGYHWDYDTSDAPDFNPSDNPAFLFHKNITDAYTHVDYNGSFSLAWFIMILGCLTFILGLFRL